MKFNGLIICISILFLVLACDSPEDKKGRFLLKGNGKIQENDLKGAIAFYSEALKIDPGFAEAYYNRGLAQKNLARPESAIADFTLAISNKPDYTDAYFQRAWSHLDLGENYKALEDANEVIKREENQFRGYFLRGLVQESLKKYQEALADFDRALSHQPDNSDLLVNKATIHYYLGDLDFAWDLLSQSEALNPEEANLYNLRSQIEFDRANYAEALKWVEVALEKDPRQPYFYNNRGLYLLFLDELEKGLEDINFSLKQNSKNLYALRNKGIYFVMKGSKDQAIPYLQEVYQKDQNIPLTEDFLKKAQSL